MNALLEGRDRTDFSQVGPLRHQSLQVKININSRELPLALVSLLWQLNIV